MIFYIALGSNLGDRKQHLTDMADYIAKECCILKKSFVYETDPEGNIDQPKYLNAAIIVETNKSPLGMLSFLLEGEELFGRVREPQKPRDSRTIDADIVLYGYRGQETFFHPRLTIPHPRMHERSFVLQPLLDLDPSLIHPIFNISLRELLEKQMCSASVLISSYF